MLILLGLRGILALLDFWLTIESGTRAVVTRREKILCINPCIFGCMEFLRSKSCLST